jgi:uncharacterized protein YbdZ (MbtH family)/MFS family permease
MTTRLSRNRNYGLLWGSQAVSEFGLSAATIAFPLVVLAATRSPVMSGLVLGTAAAASLVAGLPAGALVDRWDRKRIMLGCEAAMAVAAASLAAALWWQVATVPHMIAVAAVLGVCGALFEPAEEASLPNVVPDEQLATAVSMNMARSNLAQLTGTAAGGFLFALGRFVPFLVDALTHTVGFFALLFLRLPRRKAPAEPVGQIGSEILTGLRWVWRHHRIRLISLCAVGLNMFFSAYYVVILVLVVGRGVPSGQIGVMAAMLGVGGILGSLVAPRLHRLMSPYLSIIAVFWALTLLTPIAVFVTNGYVMGVLFATMVFLAPTANTTINTYQLLLTPDELRGRMSSVVGVVIDVAAVVGPVLGGALIAALPGSQAVLACATGVAIVTVLATASPTLRSFPRHQADEDPQAPAQEQLQEQQQLQEPSPDERNDEMDDNARYEVLRNDEDQYSLWLAGQEVPAGWHRVGKEGTREECSAYVDEVWTDMRPRSLRERMDSSAQS